VRARVLVAAHDAASRSVAPPVEASSTHPSSLHCCLLDRSPRSVGRLVGLSVGEAEHGARRRRPSRGTCATDARADLAMHSHTHGDAVARGAMDTFKAAPGRARACARARASRKSTLPPFPSDD
jgi:hypothetical protein